MPTKPTHHRASAADPVTRADLLYILDTHGLRFPDHVGKGNEVREMHWLYVDWIAQQGIRPDLPYVMPLRAMHELLCLSHGGRLSERGQYAWRVLVDAVNDPDSGLQIVQRRYVSRRSAA